MVLITDEEIWDTETQDLAKVTDLGFRSRLVDAWTQSGFPLPRTDSLSRGVNLKLDK